MHDLVEEARDATSERGWWCFSQQEQGERARWVYSRGWSGGPDVDAASTKLDLWLGWAKLCLSLLLLLPITITHSPARTHSLSLARYRDAASY